MTSCNAWGFQQYDVAARLHQLLHGQMEEEAHRQAMLVVSGTNGKSGLVQSGKGRLSEQSGTLIQETRIR